MIELHNFTTFDAQLDTKEEIVIGRKTKFFKNGLQRGILYLVDLVHNKVGGFKTRFRLEKLFNQQHSPFEQTLQMIVIRPCFSRQTLEFNDNIAYDWTDFLPVQSQQRLPSSVHYFPVVHAAPELRLVQDGPQKIQNHCYIRSLCSSAVKQISQT